MFGELPSLSMSFHLLLAMSLMRCRGLQLLKNVFQTESTQKGRRFGDQQHEIKHSEGPCQGARDLAERAPNKRSRFVKVSMKARRPSSEWRLGHCPKRWLRLRAGVLLVGAAVDFEEVFSVQTGLIPAWDTSIHVSG